MGPDTFLQSLHGWQNFYTLLGEAAATLTGLMFVAASLGARLISDEADPKVRTFLTPTVVHFSLVLLLAALMNVPTQTRAALTAQLAILGLIGAGYSLSHLPRLRDFGRDGKLSRQAWAWNLALPLVGALWLGGRRPRPEPVRLRGAGRGGGRRPAARHGRPPQRLERDHPACPPHSILIVLRDTTTAPCR